MEICLLEWSCVRDFVQRYIVDIVMSTIIPTVKNPQIWTLYKTRTCSEGIYFGGCFTYTHVNRCMLG